MTTTKTYFLTLVPNRYGSGSRLAITNEKIGKVEKTVIAENFFDAKMKFGFELTDIQSDLLNS